MKNEKDFLDSMWSEITRDQEELMQEHLVSERDKRLKIRTVKLIIIPVLCLVALLLILSLSNMMQYPLIFIISILATLIAYGLDILIYKEGGKNGN